MAVELPCDPLPCAAIQEEIEDYIDRLNDYYSGKNYQELHHTTLGKYILTSSNIDSNYNVGIVTKFNSLADLEKDQIDLYLNPRFGPCCSQSHYLTESDCLLAGFDCGSLALVDCETLSLVEKRIVFHNVITCLKVSFDEKFCIGGDLNSRIAIMDLEELRATQFFDPAHASSITDLAYHPQDSRIFVSAAQNEILLWDIRTRTPASQIMVTSSLPTSVIFPESERLVVGTETGKIINFDLKSKNCQQTVSIDDPVYRIEILKNSEDNNFNNYRFNVIAKRTFIDGGVVTFFDDKFEVRKCLNYPNARISSIFKDNNKLYAVGEDRFFEQINL